MGNFNPYLVDEIVTQTDRNNRDDLFGLIGNSMSEQTELYGFEITLSGKLVLPELHPNPEQGKQQAALW